MTREEALRRVKGYLTDIIPAEDYSEVEEILKALDQNEDRKISNNDNRETDGAIVYKPHCSKCDVTINERVSYRNIITECGLYKNLAHPTTEVSPSRCRCCNQSFNRIEIQIPEQQPTEYLI